MKTSDELLEATARAWIEGGGDAEGIAWCWRELQDKVRELLKAEKAKAKST